MSDEPADDALALRLLYERKAQLEGEAVDNKVRHQEVCFNIDRIERKGKAKPGPKTRLVSVVPTASTEPTDAAS